MKRIATMALVICMLAGCGAFGHNTYISVTPHDEEYQVAVDSSALTVSGYLSLKNAILGLVEDAVEEGVIRAESYSGDLSQDLSNAVYEVSRGDPLGAFAVDYMTYDYSQIVSYYEIHIHTTYQRSLEEIQSVKSTSGVEGVKSRLRDAMSDYESLLRLRVEDYGSLDMNALVEEVFQDNPEFALELPQIDVRAFPDTGSRRVLEIKFQYTHTKTSLEACKEETADQVEKLTNLYGSENSASASAQRLLERLVRDGELVTDSSGFSGSAYGALCLNKATSLGYCQGYLLLLRERNIPCRLVSGTYGVQRLVWCRLQVGGEVYYVDPTRGIVTGDTTGALIPEDSLSSLGYMLDSE